MYRFKLNDVEVSCDSPEELRAAIAAVPMLAPVIRDQRTVGRRRKSAKRPELAKAWAVARFFTEQYPNKNLSVAKARSHLADNPKLREKIEEAYAKANA